MKHSPNSEKKLIAIKMASHFEKTFTNKELIQWHIQANCLLLQHHEGLLKESEAVGFLAGFGWYLIPDILDVKAGMQNSVIQKGLLDLFNYVLYDNLKTALSEIGKAFLTAYSKLGYDPFQVTEFMSRLSCFMALAEMYGDYAAIEADEQEQKKVSKTANDIITEIFKPLVK